MTKKLPQTVFKRPPTKKDQATCAFCPNQVKRKGCKFCSRECSNAYNKNSRWTSETTPFKNGVPREIVEKALEIRRNNLNEARDKDEQDAIQWRIDNPEMAQMMDKVQQDKIDAKARKEKWIKLNIIKKAKQKARKAMKEGVAV